MGEGVKKKDSLSSYFFFGALLWAALCPQKHSYVEV